MKQHNYPQLNETVYEELLPNGLKVFLIPKPDYTEISGYFATQFGGVDSDKKLNTSAGWQQALPGVAHFLEHRMFDAPQGQVFDLFSALGAQSNAYTSHENTVYYFTATDHARENILLLLDFVQGFRVSADKVENEKDIIIQELRMYADMPEQQLYRGLIENMYKDHPYRIDIGGTEDSVRATTKELLEACHRTFYHPSNMVLVVAGAFDVNQMIELIANNQSSKTFSSPLDYQLIPYQEPKEVVHEEGQKITSGRMIRQMIGYKLAPFNEQGKPLSRYMMSMHLLTELLFSRSGPYYEEWVNNGWITPSLQAFHEIDRGYNHIIISANILAQGKLVNAVNEVLSQPLSEKMAPIFERLKKQELGQLVRSLNQPSQFGRTYLANYLSGFDMFDDIEHLQNLRFEEMDALRASIISSPSSVFTLLPEGQSK